MRLLPVVLLVAASALVRAPPPGFDPFYSKYVDAKGIGIVGSRSVGDGAFAAASEIVEHMLSKRDDVRKALSSNRAFVAIIAPDEKFTDLPGSEGFRGKANGKGRKVENRCAGGATKRLGRTTICEKNLSGALRPNECLLIHEFAHTIQLLGLDDDARAAISAAWEHAVDRSLFQNARGQPSYAMRDEKEFFAVTSAIWFGATDPKNPVAPVVSTRADLAKHDPEIYGILAKLYADDDWAWPRGRATAVNDEPDSSD